MTKEQKLDELIKEIEKKDKARGLSDEYLREHHYMTREELGIGEYSYGVIMIPTDFVLDYLKELQEQQEENKKKDKIINEQLKEDVKLQAELNVEKNRCMVLANNDKFKEQMIDLMSEKLAKAYHHKPNKCTLKEKNNIDCDKYKDCVSCVKQYWERKAEDVKN